MTRQQHNKNGTMKKDCLLLELDELSALKLIELLNQLRDEMAQQHHSDIATERCDPGDTQPELPLSDELASDSSTTRDPPF